MDNIIELYNDQLKDVHERVVRNYESQWHDLELSSDDIDEARDIIRSYMYFVQELLKNKEK